MKQEEIQTEQNNKIPHENFPVSYKEALQVWIKVAANSFGGPAGQIAVMHKILVEEKKWISENRFLHALNYCMLLPGPEAQQLATYIGWLMHKTKGGLTAGLLFVLPGFLSILVLSILYSVFNHLSFVQAIFAGIKPAVIAIVIGAVIRIGKKSLKNEAMLLIAIISFLLIFLFSFPFPLLVLISGITGFLGGKVSSSKFNIIKGHADIAKEEKGLIDDFISDKKPSSRVTVKTGLTWIAVWLIPIVILFLITGKESTLFKEAVFFSKAALVTFGGAYSVLAFIAQKAVEEFHWLYPGEMLDGLGMAESTPGPLIQVVQFVGFMGAFRDPGVLGPVMSGIIASLVVTWVTYAPCFLYIFTGGPYIEYVRGNKNLTAALSGITASVVGVIANLSLWFIFHTLFMENITISRFGASVGLPVLQSVSLTQLGLTVVALISFFGFKLGMFKTILISVAGGLILYLIQVLYS